MVNVRIERHIYSWRYQKDDIEAKATDKVIFKLNNGHVVSGVIKRIGTKNIELQTYGNLQGKMTLHLNWKIIKIDDIKKFCVFPKDYQKYDNKILY